MKLTVKHYRHTPSSTFTALIEKELESLRSSLQIDEARIIIERRHEASPPFRIAMHLVTPGPDLVSESVDHTLRAAMQKAVGLLWDKIGLRSEKRARRANRPFKTAAARMETAASRR